MFLIGMCSAMAPVVASIEGGVQNKYILEKILGGIWLVVSICYIISSIMMIIYYIMRNNIINKINNIDNIKELEKMTKELEKTDTIFLGFLASGMISGLAAIITAGILLLIIFRK